jgi:transcriptional regulator with XRE-family HTH domain
MTENTDSVQDQTQRFGFALKTARENKNWPQMELARQSRVSTRTIVDIEHGNQKRPRQDIVTRLAKALEQDPINWLKLAGYSNVANERVERIIQESGGFRFRGEIEPAEFFHALRGRLNSKQPVLLSVAYPSTPGSLHRLDVQRILVDLFNNGLWVAMVCPFPRVREIEKAKRPSLARHYREVFGNVIELARELRSNIAPDKRGRLGVFVPRQKQDEPIRYVMPLAGLTEYRPTLAKYFPKTGTDEASFELSAWVTLMQEKRDRWLRIYPAPGEPEGETRFQKFLCWRDYFSDILNNCDAKKENAKGWKPQDFQNTDWELIDLEPES